MTGGNPYGKPERFTVVSVQADSIWPTRACHYCKDTSTKIEARTDTRATWVACATCFAQGPYSSSVDGAVHAWNRGEREQ